MIYCQSASKATVNYRFSGQKKDIYVSHNPPIDVVVSPSQSQYQSISQDFNFTFDGNVLRSYSYTCEAPAGTPSNAACYITAGTWDDYGSIGSYSSPTVHGQLNSFSGSSVEIGQGLQFSGNVVNTIKPYCSVTLTLEWRWGEWSIKVLEDGQVKFQDSGNSQPIFNVACNDNCPDGCCKCRTIKYPGYCCLPCKDVGNRINNLAERL